MELPVANQDVVEFILIYVDKTSLPPYDFLLLMVILFGVTCWYTAAMLKRIRKNENKLKRKVATLDRAHYRDSKKITALESKLDKLLVNKASKE